MVCFIYNEEVGLVLIYILSGMHIVLVVCLFRTVVVLYHGTYHITGNVCCDFIFAKIKKRENLTLCKFHSMYCACSVCAKIKSRKNLKLKMFVTNISGYTVGIYMYNMLDKALILKCFIELS